MTQPCRNLNKESNFYKVDLLLFFYFWLFFFFMSYWDRVVIFANSFLVPSAYRRLDFGFRYKVWLSEYLRTFPKLQKIKTDHCNQRDSRPPTSFFFIYSYLLNCVNFFLFSKPLESCLTKNYWHCTKPEVRIWEEHVVIKVKTKNISFRM